MFIGICENTTDESNGPTMFITANLNMYTEVNVIGSLVKLNKTIRMGTKTYEK